MANKQRIKVSEARILLYLLNVDKPHKYARRMSIKLDTDYVYLIRILQQMKEKNWIKSIRRGRKVFYEPAYKAPTEDELLQLV